MRLLHGCFLLKNILKKLLKIVRAIKDGCSCNFVDKNTLGVAQNTCEQLVFVELKGNFTFP